MRENALVRYVSNKQREYMENVDGSQLNETSTLTKRVFLEISFRENVCVKSARYLRSPSFNPWKNSKIDQFYYCIFRNFFFFYPFNYTFDLVYRVHKVHKMAFVYV